MYWPLHGGRLQLSLIFAMSTVRRFKSEAGGGVRAEVLLNHKKHRRQSRKQVRACSGPALTEQCAHAFRSDHAMRIVAERVYTPGHVWPPHTEAALGKRGVFIAGAPKM